MKGSKSIGIVFLLLLIVCFISFPALSSENPWDADGEGGNGQDGDSTDVNGDYLEELQIVEPGGSGDEFDLITSFVYQFSYRFTGWYYHNLFGQTKSSHEKVYKANTINKTEYKRVNNLVK
ncbi:MAG: hypothetical protein ACE5D6_03540 [Candidatus Zixiibacteriota bacterium]